MGQQGGGRKNAWTSFVTTDHQSPTTDDAYK